MTTTATFPLVIGTTNLAKGHELAELLEPYGFQIETLQSFSGALDVIEDGDSFAANACKKASQQAEHLGRWVLADDSGLEVEALGGAPGIYSARYAGQSASDVDNNQKLLSELGDRPAAQRGARYTCHVAVADPTGEIRVESESHCVGRIRCKPVGTNGFGYDPLFEIVEYHQTFGQLGPSVKQAISHRARALRSVIGKLVALAQNGQW